MNVNQRMIRASIIGIALLLPIAAQLACNKSAPSGGAAGTSSSSGGDGSTIFAANCSKCHSINGSGAKRAPDLTRVGAESEHTAGWLAEFIKNPASKKPGSRMPAFEGKISDADLKSLSEYLAGLK